MKLGILAICPVTYSSPLLVTVCLRYLRVKTSCVQSCIYLMHNQIKSRVSMHLQAYLLSISTGQFYPNSWCVSRYSVISMNDMKSFMVEAIYTQTARECTSTCDWTKYICQGISDQSWGITQNALGFSPCRLLNYGMY